MDKLSTKIMNRFQSSKNLWYRDRMALIKVNGITIIGDVEKLLSNHLTQIQIIPYLETKHIIGANSHHLVYWKAVKKAHGSHWNWDIRISKWICNQLPTLQVLFCQKQSTSVRCPFCSSRLEDSTHLYTCQDPSRIEL